MIALTLGANVITHGSSLGTSSVASLEWKIEGHMPVQCWDSSAAARPEIQVKSSGLALRALAKTVLANSRPMEAWEREDADEFFQSQFA
jgi:hypothetical protein